MPQPYAPGPASSPFGDSVWQAGTTISGGNSRLFYDHLPLPTNPLLSAGIHEELYKKRVIMIYLPIFLISVSAGVWLFYVQHQFESVYWAYHDGWDPMRAALEGSSFSGL